MVFEDRTLACVECGESFTFSVDDQQYHQEKGYTNEPKRCPNCRQARRSERRYGDNLAAVAAVAALAAADLAGASARARCTP